MDANHVFSILEFVFLKVYGELPGGIPVGKLYFLQHTDLGEAIQGNQRDLEISDVQILLR